MYFQRIFTPGLAINSYILGDEKTKKCVVIDPTRHVIPFIIQSQNAELEITYILETHVHADYVSGAKELKHQLNEKPRIYSSALGGMDWIPHYADVLVEKGTLIKIGEVRLEAVHAPGHTPEHIIWVCYDESRSFSVPWFVFTGDSLFVGSVGRPDLLGVKQMEVLAPEQYKTIFDVLGHLPDFVEIFPAHGEGSLCGKSLKSRGSSTIGYERRFNPCFQVESMDKWIHHLVKDLSPIPPYFPRLKKINVEGPPLLHSLKIKIWSENEGPDLKSLFLLDIRHPETFAHSHISGSINIPYPQSFSQWVGWMLPSDTPIGLIIENIHIYSDPVDQLRLMGFDQDIWVIQYEENKTTYSSSRSSFPFIEIDELAKLKPDFKSLYVLDVRTQDEWHAGHIEGTHHLELNQLESHLKELPKNETIALLCRSGQRGSLAASLLKKHGFPSVVNIRGGVQNWKQAGLPLVHVAK